MRGESEERTEGRKERRYEREKLGAGKNGTSCFAAAPHVRREWFDSFPHDFSGSQSLTLPSEFLSYLVSFPFFFFLFFFLFPRLFLFLKRSPIPCVLSRFCCFLSLFLSPFLLSFLFPVCLSNSLLSRVNSMHHASRVSL